MAPPLEQEAARRLEVRGDECSLYVYASAVWENSWYRFDRVWAVEQGTGTETAKVEMEDGFVYALWHVTPGRYKVHLEAMNIRYVVGDTAALTVDCPIGDAIFLADTANGAGLKRVDKETGRKKIQKLELSAGRATARTYLDGVRCMGPEQ